MDDGRPSEEIAKEMVYWEHIPSDSEFTSPFKQQGVPKYLTFEPGSAGRNHARMALETAIAMSVAMGRTLVLPPKDSFPSMSKSKGNTRNTQQTTFSFSDIYPLSQVNWEHRGLDIITMQEFLEREGRPGNLRDNNGKVTFPPFNLTDWDGAWFVSPLYTWLRNVTTKTNWDPAKCIAAFPSSTNPKDFQALRDMLSVLVKAGTLPSAGVVGAEKPLPVDAPASERMQAMLAGRKELCFYDDTVLNARCLHFPNDNALPGSLLRTPFYALLFFQDWRHDLWMKRFIRDHLRYQDKIQCAAARIVRRVKERAHTRGDRGGNFDSIHVRRGDCENTTSMDANRFYEAVKKHVVENATVYATTDAANLTYLGPLQKHYDVVSLKDFSDDVFGVNTIFYGMIDQLVASRSRAFIGSFQSTFSGYINQLRGYHDNRDKTTGYKDGIIGSWYYVPDDRSDFNRLGPELAASWRLIDTGVQASTSQG